MWKTIFGTIIFAGLVALVVIKHFVNMVAEFYSPGIMSESVSSSRSRGVFISQPKLKSDVIHWRKSEYSIREVWIEQATRIEYVWVFFERVIPTNYRLILEIERIGNPPGEDFLYFKDEIICNDSICNDSISVTSKASTSAPMLMLMYSEFSSSLPDSIECVVKKRKA